MKRLVFVCTLLSSLVVPFGLFLAMQLRQEPIIPYISKIEGEPKVLKILETELKDLSKNINQNLLSKGNYPISIDFENFTDETEIDDLAYALVDNNDCEIIFNLSKTWTAEQIKLVLYHEVGHCFGLEHDAPTSVMREEYDEEDVSTEVKGIPDFYKTLKQNMKNIWISDTGTRWWDKGVNAFLDFAFTTEKDSFRRSEIKKSKHSLELKTNESKKLNYQESKVSTQPSPSSLSAASRTK